MKKHYLYKELLLLCSLSIYAAEIDIVNHNTVPIRVVVFYNGASPGSQPVNIGNSIHYSTGFADITRICWIECDATMKSIRYNLNIRFPALALGGRLIIEKDGNYKYHWDTLGGDGTGTAQKDDSGLIG
jgi:hypothetical protein